MLQTETEAFDGKGGGGGREREGFVTAKVPELDAFGPIALGPFFFCPLYPNSSPTLLSTIKSKDFGNVTKLIL